MTMTFDLIDDKYRAQNIKDAATYIAQLVREGVTFRIRKDNISIEVEVTGGF